MSGNAAQVKEHMEVVGSDGKHVGAVDHMDGDRIKLTKKDDPDGSGQHHHYHPGQQHRRHRGQPGEAVHAGRPSEGEGHGARRDPLSPSVGRRVVLTAAS